MDYQKEYLNNKIKLKDIPPSKYTVLILTEAAKKEPGNYIAVIFALYNRNKKLNLFKMIQLIQKETYLQIAYERLVMSNCSQFYKQIPDKYKSEHICKLIFDQNPKEYFELIPENKKTPYMYIKMLEIDFDKYYHIVNSISPINILPNKQIISRDIWIKLIKRNPQKFIGLTPEEYIDESLCELILQISPDAMYELSNVMKLSKEVCLKLLKSNKHSFIKNASAYNIQQIEDIILEDLESYFMIIPRDKRTKKMCEVAYKKDPDFYINLIPPKYRTQEMYDGISPKAALKYNSKTVPEKNRNQTYYEKQFKITPRRTFESMPDEHKTKEMCEKYISMLTSDELLKNYHLIPLEMRSKELIEFLLLKGVNYLEEEIIPLSLVDNQLLEMTIEALQKKLIKKEQILTPSSITLLAIKKQPELEKIVQLNLDQVIEKNLYSLITMGGTIEEIASRNGVSTTYVNLILEKIKEKDPTSYEIIKSITDNNQRKYIFTTINDLKKLTLIINFIGDIDKKGMSQEQKIKFAYLLNKYINTPLEDLYRFLKYSKEDTRVVEMFLKRNLNYGYIKSENSTHDEKVTLQFNNKWLQQYNEKSFFTIKDDKPTMEHIYGDEILTIEEAQKITNILKTENIPLNITIVKQAFREYFNDNLSLYIEQLKGIDEEFNIYIQNQKGRQK